jgi:serine/threonine protein kinase
VTLSCPYCAAPVEAEVHECAHCGSTLESPVAPGDLLDGRFAIRHVLGFGALGTSFAARDRVNKCDLVVKVISPSLVPTAADAETLGTQLQMFEGRAIQGCAMHLEVGLADDLLYLTYPRVQGVTLREVLSTRAAMDRGIEREEALRLLLAIVSATSALHSATPHGALRPENVMLTAKGVVLTNGAIVGSIVPDRIEPRLRSFASAVAYVAPEVLAHKKATATADLFAIGAIAAELLTGTPSPYGLEEAGIPADIAGAIRQLLERDRTKRPGGQGTLLNGLSKLCGFDRRPAEPPLPTIDPPAAGEDDEDATTLGPTPARGAQGGEVRPGEARQGAASSPRTPSRSSVTPGASATPLVPPVPAPPSVAAAPAAVPGPLAQTQPSLPVSRMGIGRPSLAPSPSVPPRPSVPSAPHTSAQGGPPSRPPSSAVPRASGPPVASGLSSVGPSMPPPGVARPSRPSAAPVPSVPKAPSPVVLAPSAPGMAVAPRIPKLPGMAAPAAPAALRAADRREPDGIDPKLLQAARVLQSEATREIDLDTGEIELIDD